MKKFIIGGGVVAILAIIGVYMYAFQGRRDVQAAKIDINIEAKSLVDEFIKDNASANAKYLAEDGDSKILAVTGSIFSISTDAAGLPVVYLKGETDKMGVSCTFTEASKGEIANIKVKDLVKIKGVVRSGAEYDEDLDLYEDVIIEKCSLL